MRRLPRGALRLALSGLSRWPVSDEKISFEYKLKRFLEGCLMPAERAHVHWNGTFSDAQKESLLSARPLPRALDRTLARAARVLLGGDDLTPYLWFDQKYYPSRRHPGQGRPHEHGARRRGAAAVPRSPDRRIRRVPSSAALKIRGSRQKFILKELMKGKLPPSILRRKKIGFDIPAHEWLRGPLRSLLLDTLGTGAAEHSGLFRVAAGLTKLRAAAPERRAISDTTFGA